MSELRITVILDGKQATLDKFLPPPRCGLARFRATKESQNGKPCRFLDKKTRECSKVGNCKHKV